ncbi:uncharacterized protein LOC126779858 [Nymphalis io]|uniref:uncharacterized protein LOC126779858 n=1 Tax=Inachis io TaxID=171585 RepID=UPI002169D393|nr:uncharacterized protein LOC126779858 [Nymphalis io]
MRFYLLYKNHGLYDPVLDDTEDYYVPITEEDLQTSNISGQTYTINYADRQNVENNYGANVTKSDTKFEDQMKSNLKDVFLHINVDDLPPSARFKLPVSDEYDPEGRKMSKLQRLYQNLLNIDLKKVSQQIRLEENKTVRHTDDIRQDINREIAKEILRQNEMTKKDSIYTENNKQEWDIIRETATDIVEKSINKALSIAKMKQNTKIEKNVEFENTEIKMHKESKDIEALKESKVEKVENKTELIQEVRIKDTNEKKTTYEKKELKKVTFNEDVIEDKSYEESQNEETINIESDSRLTAEKRKLLTRQDIEEAIKPGTVRDRTEIFNKHNIINDVNKSDKYEKTYIKESEQLSKKMKRATDDTTSNIKMAQQRVFNVGAQTINNIRRATYPTFVNSLLKSFFSHITKVMIRLSKYVRLRPLPYFTKTEEKQSSERSKAIKENVFSKEGQLIIKSKLSGAKIAQIEGMKPEELTKKMNIVILELQRKSGIEEELDKKDYVHMDFDEKSFNEMDFSKEGLDKKGFVKMVYNKDKKQFVETDFDEKDFNEMGFDKDFEYDGSRNKSDVGDDTQGMFYQSYTRCDNKQNNYQTYETTKTQSMEIREMKTKKRCSEYKTTKIDSNVCNEQNVMRNDDGNIIYIAIVESHVYTNRDAIFEEHLRRMSESKSVIEKTELNKLSDLLETTDKLNVYVALDDTRKLSFASDTMIPVDHSPLNEFETQSIKYIRSATDLENVAKKIAVQNITQIIEPLLHMENKQHISNKQAHAVLEMPVISIAETTDVSTEEKQAYFQAQVFVSQKSYMSVEEPCKPVIEITEIDVDEDESAVIEESQIKVELPEATIETPVKSIAEISEVITKEDDIVEIAVTKPNTVEVHPILDITAKTVAVTSEVLSHEASVELFDVPKTAAKTSDTVMEKTSMSVAETTTTSPERSSEFLSVTEARKETAKMNISENLAIEVSHVSFEEPKNEKINVQKSQFEQANITLTTSVAAEVLEIAVLEKEPETFDVPIIKDKKMESLMENFVFSIAEITQEIPNEPRNEPIEEIKTTNQNATLQIQEFNATEANVVYPSEPKFQSLEIKDITEIQPQALVEQTNFTVAEQLTILPEETSKEIDVTIAPNQQADIAIEELKAAEIITVSTEEPAHENLEVLKIVEKLPQTLMESCVLTLAEAQAIIPEGPKDEYFEIPPLTTKQTKILTEPALLTIAESIDVLPDGPKEGVFKVTEASKEQTRIDLDDLKPLHTTTVFIEEQHEEFQVPQVDQKIPQTLMENPILTIPISLAILPEGPKDGPFEIDSVTSLEPKVDFEEFKAAAVTIVFPEEPKQKNLDIPIVLERQPLSEIESPRHSVAEILAIIPEGPEAGSLELNKIPEEKIKVNFNELHSLETTSTSLGESVKEDMIIQKTIEKKLQTQIQEMNLNIAETLTITPEEPKDETFVVNKTVNQEARINIEELKAAESKIIMLEETINEDLELPDIKKSLEKQVNVSLVESTATMVAEQTAVTVAKEETFKFMNKVPVTATTRDVKLEIVDVSDDSRSFEDVDLNYTVELPKEHDDKVNEVFAEATITKQKTPPLEVFAEYEFNEKKTQQDSIIYESIKLLKKKIFKQSTDESFSYTALITDEEFNRKVEEELIKIISTTEASEYIKNGDISTFSFSLASSALTPLIEEYMFRIRGPSLRRFQYIDDVFEEATFRLKSKFQSSTVENFDASLTLILQDIATSQLQSEVIDVDIESTEYISETDIKKQYFESQKTSKLDTSVQAEKQSLHTGLAIASAATKQTIETGIDVTVLAIEEEPLIEATRSKAVRKTKSSKKSARAETSQAELKASKLEVSDARHIEAMESEASLHSQSLGASMEVSMGSLSMEMNQEHESHLQVSKRKHIEASRVSASASDFDHETIISKESVTKSKSLESDKKLSIKTDLRTNEAYEVTNGESPSPPLSPPTPLTDEYIFRLEIPLPEECEFVPRDCSYSPESIEDEIILRNGLIPHIITRIERIIYSPPLPTPPISPERQIIPIYRKPTLKGGSGDDKTINASFFKFIQRRFYEMDQTCLANQIMKAVDSMIDPNASLEQQVAQMKAQLAALSQLPNLIQQKVDAVSRQISQISQMEYKEVRQEKYLEINKTPQERIVQFEKHPESHRQSVEITEIDVPENESTGQRGGKMQIRVTKPSLTEDEVALMKREEVKRMLESKMKKEHNKEFIHQIKEQQPQIQNKPTPMFGPAPPERPLILPGGRKWKKSREYDEELIQETLTAQAEVIKGNAIGVNFMKYQKPPKGLDHLQHSEVYKAIHNMDEARPKRVAMLMPSIAEADYRELEVLVDFGANPDENVVNKTLKYLNEQDGVKQAVFKDGAVMVETTLPSSVILDMVTRTSGRRSVLQGFGDTQSAVAMISSQRCCKQQVLGVIRFQQNDGGPLVGDGSVDGLAPGPHGLHVHDAGDLSLGCNSIGDHYNPHRSPHGAPSDPPDKRHAGDLGNIVADDKGRATFRILDSVLNIYDIVGRSVAIKENADDFGRGSSPASKTDGDSGASVACGIIARSAGIFQNPKRICACDGVVVWDEKDRPLAGKGRRDKCCHNEKDLDKVKVCCKV